MTSTIIALLIAISPAQHDNSGTQFMYEDEAPYTSPTGSSLVSYSDGQAWYADGCTSNGVKWVCP